MVQNIDQRAVDTVRCLAADVVKGANSGHPGNLICACMKFVVSDLTDIFRCSYGLCPYGSCLIQQVHDLQPQEPQVHQPRSFRSFQRSRMCSSIHHAPYLRL